MELAELYDKTADIIEERGLAHGRLEDLDGRVCVFGALHVVLFGRAVPEMALAGNHHKCTVFESDIAKRVVNESVVEWADRHAAVGNPKPVIDRLRMFAIDVRAESSAG